LVLRQVLRWVNFVVACGSCAKLNALDIRKMNNLQHIRSMAEMILQKVDELAGSKPEVKLRKFAVGETVYFLNCAGDEVQGTIVDVHQYDLDRYIVESCGLYKSWMSEKQLSKKSNAKPTPKFKVGDKVTWKSDFFEKVYTVVSVYFDQITMDAHAAGRVTFPNETGVYFMYDVVRPNGDSMTFGEAALELYAEPEVEEREWHSGPPPHVGWWNASRHKDKDTWRWWNGESWSGATLASNSPAMIEQLLSERYDCCDMEWCDYWPENARVPRINPSLHTAANKHVVQYGDTKWVFDPRDGDIWQYWS
jgi:transcription antitermination factor NusG